VGRAGEMVGMPLKRKPRLNTNKALSSISRMFMATRFLKDNKGATLISKVYYFNRKISFILYLLPIKILLTTPSDPILFFLVFPA